MFLVSFRGQKCFTPHLQFYSKKAEMVQVPDHLFLYKILVDHLESHLPKKLRKGSKIACEEVPYEIRSIMFGKNSVKTLEETRLEKTEVEVREILEASIAKTMRAINERRIWSKKGVMYPLEYAREIYGYGDETLQDYLAVNWRIKNQGYSCFEVKNDVCQFVARKKFPASQAIEAFFEGPTCADCASTIQAVYHKAILDIVGERKFDKLFSDQKERMKISRFGTMDPKTFIFPFVESVDSKFNKEIDENQLKIGDDICILGVPSYNLKHPYGVMSSLHSVVMGYNEENEILAYGLGMKRPGTIREIKQMLVDAHNLPQTSMEVEYFERRGKDNKFTLDQTTLEVLEGCKVINARRLSTYVLAALKEASESDDLRKVLHHARSVSLARQFRVSRDECERS